MGSWGFGYDTLNRLTGAASGATAPAPFANNNGCWSYDAFGNRATESMSTTACANNPPLMSWADFNASNQFTATNQDPGGVAYDAAGDITNDGVNTYLYDAEGRVCAVKSQPIPGTYTMTGYIYDAEGERVSKGSITSMSCDPTASGYQATNDYVRGPSGEQLTELGSDGKGNMTWLHTNVFADGQLMATYNPDSLHFHLNDWLGTRRVQTDNAGVVEQSCASLPFGDGESCYQGPTEHLYAGLERDDETGLDHAMYRQYASAMGRWTTPDPYNGSYDLMNPQSLNRYSYVNGSPLANIDPSGLAGAGVLTGVGGSSCFGYSLFSPGFPVNPCSPVASLTALGIKGVFSVFDISATVAQIVPFASFGYTIGCSFVSNSDLCGQSGWTSLVFTGRNKWAGTAINDAVAYAGLVDALEANAQNIKLISCVSGGFANPVCDVFLALAIYTVANEIISAILQLFGDSNKFQGSLQPRPEVPSQADILHTLGAPINGHNLYQQTGQKQQSPLPSPTPITMHGPAH